MPQRCLPPAAVELAAFSGRPGGKFRLRVAGIGMRRRACKHKQRKQDRQEYE